MIKDGVDIDLSEQYLVSCNSSGWSCSGGSPAHDYHQSRDDFCGDDGAVLESDFPYAAANLACDCPYPHAYWIDSWGWVGDAYTVPPVDDIKQAIMEYGPVSDGVP